MSFISFPSTFQLPKFFNCLFVPCPYPFSASQAIFNHFNEASSRNKRSCVFKLPPHSWVGTQHSPHRSNSSLERQAAHCSREGRSTGSSTGWEIYSLQRQPDCSAIQLWPQNCITLSAKLRSPVRWLYLSCLCGISETHLLTRIPLEGLALSTLSQSICVKMYLPIIMYYEWSW